MVAISRAEMVNLEQKAIEEFKIPSIVLMENAAMGFVSSLTSEFGSIDGKKICVTCGKGNNAGDGYAIARLLYFGGANVEILPVFDENLLSGDAMTNMICAKNMGISFIKELSGEYDIIVDAIFGTGTRGEVLSPAREIIEKINSKNSYIASVDVPSGVSSAFDTGDCFVKCDLCVTFGYIKHYMLLGKAQASFKKLVVAPISIPEPDDAFRVIDKKTFPLIPKRESVSHKGTFGKVLALVGACGMAGAAVLSGSAVLKSGAGMLTLAVPEQIVPTIVHEFPSAMTLPLTVDTDISQKAQGMDALLIGCGLGTEDMAKKNFEKLINCEKPTVIDADGLNILSENIDLIKDKNVILTPHIAEFSRLSGVSIENIKENPIAHLKEFCSRFNVCVVLKDAVTVICHKGKDIAICHAPNSGMATAGSGDVLAGIIASMLAQGLDTFSASCVGVYLHSSAGKLAKDALSEAGMTSSDILNFVPKAFMAPVDIAPHIKEL